MIWTTISMSLIYDLLVKYCRNLSFPRFLPTSTHTIFTIRINQHIVMVTALKQLFWKMLVISSFLLTKATCLFTQIPFKHLTNLHFTLDCHLTMNADVSIIARTCYFELRRLLSICRFLASTATVTLYLTLFCQGLTTVAHYCSVLLMMWHPTCNGYRTMQLV